MTSRPLSPERFALRALAPHWPRFLLAVAQVLLITLLELAKPWPLKVVLDAVLPGQPIPWLPAPVAGGAGLLALASLGLVTIYATLGALQVWNNFTTISLGQRMVHELRSRTYLHLQRLSLAFHSRASVGDLIYRVASDTYAIQTYAMNGLFPVLASALLLLGMFAVMLRLDAAMTGVALLVTPALLLVLARMNCKLGDVARRAREQESQVYEQVERGMSAIKVVQAFVREEREHRDFLLRSRRALETNLALYTLQTAFSAATSVLLAAGTAAVLWIGARRVANTSLTAGDLVVFVSYLGSLYGPLQAMVHTYGVVQGARAGLLRVLEVLGTPNTVADGWRSLPAPVRGHIRFEHVWFSYRPGEPTLADIDFEVRPGEVVALVGPTGAGKSTLVSLLVRFYDPEQGRITIDGVDVRELKLAALREAVAMVLQPPIVFPLSVRENIAYGRPEASDAEIEQAARIAQAHEFIERLPQGYDTIVGSQGATLSEGEKQRLTIARALLRQSPILVLDEPTASLDATTEAQLFTALRNVMRGRTTVVIAHRLSTVRSADQVLVLERGRIVERGRFNELLERRGLLYRLYAHSLGEEGQTGAAK